MPARQGIDRLADRIAASGRAADGRNSLSRDADTVYNRRPWQSNEERLTDDALASWTIPAAMIRDIRPPYPQRLHRPRFGYERRALTIDDVAHVDDLYQRVDYSGRRSGYSGTSFPALGIF